MQIVLVILGVLLALLGGAWMLEGLGLYPVPQVSIGGPSILGAILGLLAIVAGGALIAWSRRGRPRV